MCTVNMSPDGDGGGVPAAGRVAAPAVAAVA